MSNMTEKYNPFADNRWYGKEFTKKGALVMTILLLLHIPMHEFGHWFAYWLFGIPASFGFITDPIWACTVHASFEPAPAIRLFASFFGGGFVGIVCLIISIKIRPVLIPSIIGFSAGLTEVYFFATFYYDFTIMITDNILTYVMLHVIPVLIVFIIGLPEFQWFVRTRITQVIT